MMEKSLILVASGKRVSLFDVISEAVGEKVDGLTPKAELTKIATKKG